MKRLKFKSLTMRIWTTFTIIILIIICSLSLLYFLAFRRISENNKMEDLKVAHDILLKSDNFSQPNRFDEMKNLKGNENFIYTINSNNEIEIKNLNKRDNLPPDAVSQGKDVPPPYAIDDEATQKWMASFVKGESSVYLKEFKETYNNVKFLFVISSISSDKTGKSYLISYMPNRQDNSLFYMFIIVGVIFIAIGFITAKIVAQVISKPLKELESHTLRIAKKDWGEPIEVKSEDEIGRLTSAMNHMQKELKRAEEEEKTFLQSISHDLKTPVMVIMSHADAIIDGVYIDSLEKTAQIIRDEAITLEKKIKQILYLNTLDYVLENNSENIEINLRDFMLYIINRFEVINSKIEWKLNLEEIIIKGNADKIKVAIENILDNSLRYAREKISVKINRENSFAVLEIYNDGPNISEKHIGHIFDNMYKDKTGNFGLGLAISKKIIDFYGGEIKAINRENGVSFIIKYPM